MIENLSFLSFFRVYVFRSGETTQKVFCPFFPRIWGGGACLAGKSQSSPESPLKMRDKQGRAGLRGHYRNRLAEGRAPLEKIMMLEAAPNCRGGKTLRLSCAVCYISHVLKNCTLQAVSLFSRKKAVKTISGLFFVTRPPRRTR